MADRVVEAKLVVAGGMWLLIPMDVVGLLVVNVNDSTADGQLEVYIQISVTAVNHLKRIRRLLSDVYIKAANSLDTQYQ